MLERDCVELGPRLHRMLRILNWSLRDQIKFPTDLRELDALDLHFQIKSYWMPDEWRPCLSSSKAVLLSVVSGCVCEKEEILGMSPGLQWCEVLVQQILQQYNQLLSGTLGFADMEMSYWHHLSSLNMC